jgi:hypothetical protein
MIRISTILFSIAIVLTCSQGLQAQNSRCSSIASGGNGPNLFPGQKIKIPKSCSKSPSRASYVVQKGDGWSKIARKHGCSAGLEGAIELCDFHLGNKIKSSSTKVRRPRILLQQ